MLLIILFTNILFSVRVFHSDYKIWLFYGSLPCIIGHLSKQTEDDCNMYW